MDNVEKIVIGLVVFVITSVIAYLFRVRQLYVVAPTLYRHAPVSNKGSLCEIIVFNKGRQVEEKIQVELDPDLNCELLASSSAEVTLEGSTIKIDRLHKGCKESAILLVELGVLDFSKITSISSKNTKGAILKRLIDVPPNYARMTLLCVLMAGIIPILELGTRGYRQINNLFVEHQLESLIKEGWHNLENYYSSDLKLSYSNHEFPIRYIGKKLNGQKNFEITYEIYNKTAATLKVYADKKGARGAKRDFFSPYFSAAEVSPMSKQPFMVKVPNPSAGLSYAEIEFSISWGAEYLHGITNAVELIDETSE